MKEQDYAFAVARIRANEAKLLTSQDYDNLISADNINACYDILASKNLVDRTKEIPSVSQLVNGWSKDLWTLVTESVPDKKEAEIFCVENDFFNLKAAVKCSLSGKDASSLFKYPTTLDTEKLSSAVDMHDFASIGEPYGEACQQAYDVACKTENGQSADIIIDKATLSLMAEKKKADKGMLAEILEFTIACANIKTALRCLRTGKDKNFAESCLCECDSIDVKKLAELSCGDEDALFDYLSKTVYSKGTAILKENSTAFEKWCDDSITEITKSAKFKFFGFDPIIAYYYAKTTEIKMLRLILCAKESGLTEEIIKERMRLLYV